MAQISILGCGWLGLPLAETLRKNGFEINGSTTSEAKTGILKKSGINPFLISFSDGRINGNVSEFLAGSEILIITIPPKLRSGNESFTEKIKQLISVVETSSVSKIIFISSISVYGTNSQTVDEATTPVPDSPSGIQLLESERLLLAHPKFTTTVVRFGGLLGPGRHPVRTLSGKTGVENPDAPINLIDQEDCISILLTIIRKQAWAEIFNAVAPFHPTRAHYYTQKAAAFGLTPPQFSTRNAAPGKIVLASKLESVLGYRFIHPEP